MCFIPSAAQRDFVWSFPADWKTTAEPETLHSFDEQSSGPWLTKRHPEDPERIAAAITFSVPHRCRRDGFKEYEDTFLEYALSSAMKTYPMLSGGKLKTELIYR